MKQMITTENDLDVIRNELIKLIIGGNAHAPFEAAIKDIPFLILGKKVGHVPYTIWQLAEHIRITQWDILEFSKGPDHQSPSWPDEYWPAEIAPKDENQWKATLQQILENQKEFIELLNNKSKNLFEPFP
jgi:hypothetical protein